MFYSPALRQLYISGDLLFDENFSSSIATTWKLHRDFLALRPISSEPPVVTTTLEHTRGVDDNPHLSMAGVEEGSAGVDMDCESHDTPPALTSPSNENY